MKKTISISLGKQSFQIEEDAYGHLEKYLKDVRAYFGSNAEAEEIVEDIETRFAEQLIAKGADKRTVEMSDVEALIATMGTPEQVKGDDAGTNHKKDHTIADKKFYRDPDDQIIAGVASGLAHYFHIDPVWVRLAFFIFIFTWGFGVAIYLILWLITPEAKTETEKSQMRGEKINLSNIEQTIKQRVAEFKKKDFSKVNSALSHTGELAVTTGSRLGQAVKTFFLIIAKILGIVLVIAGALALASVVFAFVTVLFNLDSSYVYFPLQEITTNSWYYAGLASAFFVVFVPLSFLLTLGSSLIASKSKFTTTGSLTLLAVWVVAIAVAANAGIKLAPEIEHVRESNQAFQTETKNLDLKDFTGLELSGAQQATIHQGEAFEVLATASTKSLDQTRFYVNSKGNLVAENTKPFHICLFYCRQEAIIFDITAPSISKVDASGASKVYGVLSGDTVSIDLSGASKAEVDISATNLDLDFSGDSRATLTGQAQELKAKLSGASKLEAEKLQANSASLDASGASKVYFATLDKLKVDLSGASHVSYYEVNNLTQDLSGASKVEQVTEK